jgi:hypothetical protein
MTLDRSKRNVAPRRRRVTVGELRDWLAGFEPEALLLVDGYEGGYDRPRVHLANVRELDEDEEMEYSGIWEDSEGGEVAIIVSRHA